MKRKIENIESLGLFRKYHECKKWQSEIKTWEESMQFIKRKIMQFLGDIKDDCKRIEARTFFNELEGKLKGTLNWLTQKLDIYEIELKSFFKENNLKSSTEIERQHDLYKKYMLQLKEDYSDIRTDFFQLFKPLIRSKKTQNQLKNVA